VDLGVMGVATGAGEVLKLLLEVCTGRSTDDPRAETVTTNLSRAADQVTTAADHIGTLFTASPDVAAIIYPPGRAAHQVQTALTDAIADLAQIPSH
jgi:hypothetical protein